MRTREAQSAEMRLYNDAAQRLYVNSVERTRFEDCAMTATLPQSSFALTLLHTGCRISEALEVKLGSIQHDAQLITFRTLKRRQQSVYREVPIPPQLIELLQHQQGWRRNQDDPIWVKDGMPVNRSTGYRWVKEIMIVADVLGAQACPKGMRHGFAIHAINSGVPLNMVQKWLGHADIKTTAIYANASGQEELELAGRMW